MTNPYAEQFARLPDEVRWALSAADGYLDLGLLDRARAELGKVPEPHCASAFYRRIGLRLAALDKNWEEAQRLAEQLHAEFPEDCALWIEWAYAARRATGIPAARKILQNAWSRFPRIAVIPFNLACYAVQEGDLEQGRDLLSRAFALEEGYRAIALEDDDLKPLWDELG